MWSRLDAENSVKNRLMLDVVRVVRLLRTDTWNLQALVQDCPVPVLLLAATDDSALTEPDWSVLMNRLPADHIAVLGEWSHDPPRATRVMAPSRTEIR